MEFILMESTQMETVRMEISGAVDEYQIRDILESHSSGFEPESRGVGRTRRYSVIGDVLSVVGVITSLAEFATAVLAIITLARTAEKQSVVVILKKANGQEISIEAKNVQSATDVRRMLEQFCGRDTGEKLMRILFLAANPATTTALDLEEELRSLENELRGVKFRDQVVLTARFAVRADDLIRHVRDVKPNVIHFSGHGSSRGIVLRSDDGGYTEVSGQSLRRFLDGRGIGLLVLNACFTKVQADHVAGVVEAVVGTTDAVGDEAARRFTVAFYRGLGNGLSIKEAFRDGGDAVALHGLEDVFLSSGKLDQVPLGTTQF
jgi:hypothetical protein